MAVKRGVMFANINCKLSANKLLETISVYNKAESMRKDQDNMYRNCSLTRVTLEPAVGIWNVWATEEDKIGIGLHNSNAEPPRKIYS